MIIKLLSKFHISVEYRDFRNWSITKHNNEVAKTITKGIRLDNGYLTWYKFSMFLIYIRDFTPTWSKPQNEVFLGVRLFKAKSQIRVTKSDWKTICDLYQDPRDTFQKSEKRKRAIAAFQGTEK